MKFSLPISFLLLNSLVQAAPYPAIMKREAEPVMVTVTHTAAPVTVFVDQSGKTITPGAQPLSKTSIKVAGPSPTHAILDNKVQNKAVTTQAKPKSAKPTSSEPTSTARSGGSGSASSNIKSFGSNGAIGFSQYNSGGSCKSESQIAAGIKAMSSYSVIRLYDVDCDLVRIALQNKGSGQKLLVGIYKPDSVESGVGTIKRAVSDAKASWDDIFAVTVGNEHVNDGTFNAWQMSNYVSQAQSALKAAANQKIPVAAVDVYSIIFNNGNKNNNKELCKGDFIGANAHSYFAGIDPSTAGSWLKDQIGKIQDYCGTDVPVLITETGWPSADSSNSAASSSNQKACINSIKGDTDVLKVSTLFSMWNEEWKSSVVEKSWGFSGSDPNA